MNIQHAVSLLIRSKWERKLHLLTRYLLDWQGTCYLG